MTRCTQQVKKKELLTTSTTATGSMPLGDNVRTLYFKMQRTMGGGKGSGGTKARTKMKRKGIQIVSFRVW
jgi:hypothetical protein